MGNPSTDQVVQSYAQQEQALPEESYQSGKAYERTSAGDEIPVQSLQQPMILNDVKQH